jgi:hypothetical protein
MTATLATLDYASAEAVRTVIGNMITSRSRPQPGQPPVPAHDAVSGPGKDAAGSDWRPRAAGEPGAAGLLDAPPGPQTVTAVPASAGPPQPQSTPALRGQGVAGLDEQLIEAAKRIAAEAAGNGTRLSQAALAEKLRGEGRAIANDRLSWLAATIGLGSRRG